MSTRESRNETKKYGWAFAVGINIIIAVIIGLVINFLQTRAIANSPTVSGTPTPTPTASSASSSPPTPTKAPDTQSKYDLNPKILTSHWVSWAILDKKSGVFAGSDNWRQPTYLMSMIKPWIAADYLNLNPNPSALTLAELSKMIIDSDDQLARKYFGEQASWDRFKRTCGIADMVDRSWSWSLTEISARDAVLYADCIYSGKATSKKWTTWIIDKMRHVRGEGDFGPRELFQDRTVVATKNGWFFWENKWYINCLTVTDDWAISTLQQWPYKGGDLKYGISIANPTCKSVANQVLRLDSL